MASALAAPRAAQGDDGVGEAFGEGAARGGQQALFEVAAGGAFFLQQAAQPGFALGGGGELRAQGVEGGGGADEIGGACCRRFGCRGFWCGSLRLCRGICYCDRRERRRRGEDAE